MARSTSTRDRATPCGRRARRAATRSASGPSPPTATRDALLVTADPAGPTCHRGTRTCFDAEDAPPSPRAETQGFAWLEDLWSTIAERAATRPEGSYTAGLLNGGVDAAARKVTEEASEVLIAAKDDAAAESAGTPREATRAALAGETADLLYHALVVLAERDLAPAEVIAVLRDRAG